MGSLEGNVTILAGLPSPAGGGGAGGEGAGAGDLTIQGSELTAGRHLSLNAANDIRLLAASNTTELKSRNKSSSASIGVAIDLATLGVSATAGANAARGQAEGRDTVWTNTHVAAGNTLTLQSGGDATLRGAVAQGDRIIANIGGNLAIESLQDTSSYHSTQQSAGASVSLCVPPLCAGAAPVSGSVNASNSKIKSDYQSVTEQSALRAGDQGFEVAVQGNTALTGGAITSSQAAVDANRNRFEIGGSLNLTDIANHADYSAHSASLSIGAGLSLDGRLAPQGTGAGLGRDSGQAQSTTLAAISGVAGNTTARTGDAQTGIAPIFDAAKVQREIEAQARITQMFGQLAPRAGAEFANARARDLRRAGKEDEAQKWDEGGAYRIALHAAIGGLAGGTSGALGAGASAAAAPLLNDLQDNITASLRQAGAGEGVARLAGQLVSGATAAGIGAALGGNAGAVAGLNVDANNRQLHPSEIRLIQGRIKDFIARMKAQGYELTEDHAAWVLAQRAANMVDLNDRLRVDVRDDYLAAQADRFLREIGAQAGVFADTRGLEIKFFSTQTKDGVRLEADYRNGFLYREAYNDPNSHGFAYRYLDRNLIGDRPDLATVQAYLNAERDMNKRALMGLGLLAGAAGAAALPRIAAMTVEAAKACAANPVLCMNQLVLTAADVALGDAVPAGMGLAAANVLANKLFDKADPRQIEQIAARLSQYTPSELLAINGATHFRDGSRNSAEAVNALLELTTGASSPYMPGTQVRDMLMQAGQRLYVVENASAGGPGAWAASRVYTDLNEARRELALLPEWKNQQELVVNGVPTLDNLVIREYTVRQPLPTRQGMAGPQEEYFRNASGDLVQTGQRYPGGGRQVELLIDTREWVFDSRTGDALWKSYLTPKAEYRIGDLSVTPQPVVRVPR